MLGILTSSALSYISFFARKALAKHQPIIIGVAGSVGKSSTRNAIEAILKDHFPTKSIGNSETGIPLGILGMKPENYSPLDWAKMLLKSPFNIDFLKGTKYLIVEMGIDEPDAPKNMDYLLTILKPSIAVSLNVSATHSLQFDKTVTDKSLSPEDRLQAIITNIADEDSKIITKSHAQVGIYNADDTYISEQMRIYSSREERSDESRSSRFIDAYSNNKAKLLTFGSKSSQDISYGSYKVSLDGTSFAFYIKTEDKREELTLHFPNFILPREYREVFAASILVGLQTGLTIEQIKTALEKNYVLPKGRSSLFSGINNSTIIDASYNASKTSTTAFLDLVDTLKKETDRSVVLLLGDMRELGKESRIEHETVAAKLMGIVDYLYLVGPLTREYVLPIVQLQESLFKEIRWFDSANRAGEFMKENLPKSSIVLAKGSQNTIFLEEAVKQILADKNDAKNLCRQEDFWMKTKKPPGTLSL